MLISIIVAVSENRVIGKDNQLLWRLPDDLKRFKKLTFGHPIIMGRKTFDSIGKPLPGRTSIVVTRDRNFSMEGVIAVHSVREALEEAEKLETDETFIIGGGELYSLTLALADRLYITEVNTIISGDTYFNITNPDEWIETERTVHQADDKHKFTFNFVDYARKRD
ncbi:dihydrofolate reductase [Dyadobacter psychrotolerans]|uniref:Dihydrofolate reductase n=1 Tax=Dyadobacter psychrotolerans TaxID=2541721 RepID=A0A4V2Z4Z1_9BACT|nr:dihydrofolate reductase [Dyadobacter psychrotolerans]TDE18588.1 dihydrofolate reductase [Dyadobacter psychrotolerans]